jgi:hypothetical protein
VNAMKVVANNHARLRRDSFPRRAFSVEDDGERLRDELHRRQPQRCQSHRRWCARSHRRSNLTRKQKEDRTPGLGRLDNPHT